MPTVAAARFQWLELFRGLLKVREQKFLEYGSSVLEGGCFGRGVVRQNDGK